MIKSAIQPPPWALNSPPPIKTMVNMSKFSIKELLRRGSQYLVKVSDTARLDAEVILASLIKNGSKDFFYQHGDRFVSQPTVREFKRRLERRKKYEPISYIIGKKEFWSLDLKVNPSVLIPRPETELLVEISLHRLGEFLKKRNSVRVADIGTGSGAISIALAHEMAGENIEIEAIDNSKKALETAFFNVLTHNLNQKIKLIAGDLFMPIRPLSFQLIVSNPPYIRREQIQYLSPQVRNFEPLTALDGGIDGLSHIRKLVESGWIFLAPEGEMLIEIGHDQLDEVMKMVLDNGHYHQVKFYRDLAGIPRVVHCIKNETN
jgi:release factor glutamine methyltransferase